jgi:hypothetical protein
MRKPETEKYWTTLYYGRRGSGKTLHQALETVRILTYLRKLYAYHPDLKPAIVLTNQKLSDEVEEEFGVSIYYWSDADDFHFCPRENCWMGVKKHRLHGAYLIFDDISTILPSDQWNMTPIWMRKTFLQARHFGIRILANLQDPFAVDINFRRCVDVAFKFTKLYGNPDPDETKLPVKRIFGIYRRRRVDAETLWRYGDLPEQTIRLMLNEREEESEKLKKMGKEMDIVYDDSWRGSYHVYNESGKFLFWRVASTRTYDTLQDVKEYEPRGFLHRELRCIDPAHDHENPDAPNYCGHKKVIHELV